MIVWSLSAVGLPAGLCPAQLRAWRRAPGAAASVNDPAIDEGYHRITESSSSGAQGITVSIWKGLAALGIMLRFCVKIANLRGHEMCTRWKPCRGPFDPIAVMAFDRCPKITPLPPPLPAAGAQLPSGRLGVLQMGLAQDGWVSTRPNRDPYVGTAECPPPIAAGARPSRGARLTSQVVKTPPRSAWARQVPRRPAQWVACQPKPARRAPGAARTCEPVWAA